eukprot:6307298-Amphidinium_carterae.1
MIGQVELFGAVLGLLKLAFREELTNADVIHFVDNDSATSAVIKGYSGKQDSARLVGVYWMLAALHRMIRHEPLHRQSIVQKQPSAAVITFRHRSHHESTGLVPELGPEACASSVKLGPLAWDSEGPILRSITTHNVNYGCCPSLAFGLVPLFQNFSARPTHPDRLHSFGITTELKRPSPSFIRTVS